jgi:hypothetical protein
VREGVGGTELQPQRAAISGAGAAGRGGRGGGGEGRCLGASALWGGGAGERPHRVIFAVLRAVGW